MNLQKFIVTIIDQLAGIRRWKKPGKCLTCAASIGILGSVPLIYAHKPLQRLQKVTKSPFFQFTLWSLFLSHPVFAQEAIEIQIDSAPVQVEIPKPQEPKEPQKQPEQAPPQQAEKPQEPEKPQETTAETESAGGYGVAVGVGVLVAGLLAALAGGGGGGGGGSSTPQH